MVEYNRMGKSSYQYLFLLQRISIVIFSPSISKERLQRLSYGFCCIALEQILLIWRKTSTNRPSNSYIWNKNISYNPLCESRLRFHSRHFEKICVIQQLVCILAFTSHLVNEQIATWVHGDSCNHHNRINFANASFIKLENHIFVLQISFDNDIRCTTILRTYTTSSIAVFRATYFWLTSRPFHFNFLL